MVLALTIYFQVFKFYLYKVLKLCCTILEMSEIVNLVITPKSFEKKEDQKRLVKCCQERLSSSQFLIDTLKEEDELNKNNCRRIKSKKIIEDAMVVHLIKEEMISTLIEYYLIDHGTTVFIENLELYLTNKVQVYFDAKITPYLYLVDMNECHRAAYDCIN